MIYKVSLILNGRASVYKNSFAHNWDSMAWNCFLDFFIFRAPAIVTIAFFFFCVLEVLHSGVLESVLLSYVNENENTVVKVSN